MEKRPSENSPGVGGESRASRSGFSLEVDARERQVFLRLKGRLDVSDVGELLERGTRLLRETGPATVRVDLSAVTYMDGAAVAVLSDLEGRILEQGGEMVLETDPRKVPGLLSLVDRNALRCCTLSRRFRRQRLVDRLGAAAIHLLKDLFFQVSFVGELALAFIHALRHPRSVRWKDMVACMERVGVDALPIVALIAFLVGLVMGFQGSVSLQQYGVGVLLAQLVTLVMVEEMGPLMTAVIVAGRSGSAFASEIGTMKVSEELDALRVMGMAPVRFVALPKLVATVVVLPLLTLFADLVGILGGMIVGVTLLHMSFGGYMMETLSSLEAWQVIHGVIKSAIFAVLIAGIGCLRGFQTEGGAEGVGRQTTSAVVSGIFLVVLADALYRIALQVWNL